MELSEVLNFVVALCTFLLTLIAAIGLFTWKHRNRFEEKIKTLKEIFKVTCKLCDRLKDSLIHIPMIQIYIKKASNSNVELDDTPLLDAIDIFLDALGEHDTLESSIKKNGLEWAEEIRFEVGEADEILSDLEFLTLNAKAIKLESIDEIENIFKFFVRFNYMLHNISCLMTLPRSEFQTPNGINLFEHFYGLDHKKKNKEIADAGIQCRDFVRNNLRLLYG